MPMTRQQALERAQQVLDDCAVSRAAVEALTTLLATYVWGHQWSAMGAGQRGGRGVNTLRPIIKPETSVVRLAMNYIRPRYESITSRVLTPELDYTVEPRTGKTEHQLAARVGDRLLRGVTELPSSIRRLNTAQRWATLTGSGFLHRAVQPVGKGVRMMGDDGKSIRNKRGEEAIVREFLSRWGTAAPYEICRDPSANAPDFEGEDCVGFERPMLLSTLHRLFPQTKLLTTVRTMGEMLQVQMDLHAITRGVAGVGASASKAPGVCLSIWWFRDATDDPEDGNPWPRYLVAYRDTGGANGNDRELKPLWFGRNPNWGIGLHQVVFQAQPGSGWGDGCVRNMIEVQNAFNLAFSDMIRTVLIHTGNRYIVEEGSILDKEDKILSKDLSVVIRLRAGARPPTRLDPPSLDPSIASILSNGPAWFDAVSGSAAIHRGEVPKRSTSGRQAAIQVEQADAPLDAVARDMGLTVDELLMGTLADIHRSAGRADKLLDRLGDDFTYEQVATFLDMPITDAVKGVHVSKDTLRPQTAREVREDTLTYVNQGMLTPEDGRWAILKKSGEAINPGERDAMLKQQQEIQLLLAGQEVEVFPGQNHPAHMRVCEEIQDSPQWEHFSPDQREAVADHYHDHWDMKRTLAAFEAGLLPGQNPQQQSPGGIPDQGDTETIAALPTEGAGMEVPPPTGLEPVGAAPQGAAPAQF